MGLGGTRLLRALGFEIHTNHLNEGHAALLTLELLNRNRLLRSDGPRLVAGVTDRPGNARSVRLP